MIVPEEEVLKFKEYLNNINPKKPIQIYYKDEKYPPGFLWKLTYIVTFLIGLISKDFKDKWNNRISNTRGGVFLFPNREIYSDLTNPRVFAIYRHEAVHYRDEVEEGSFFYVLKYTFLPIPFLAAYYRANYEFRGYAQNLITDFEAYGVWDDAMDANCRKYFSGSLYLWMWPWKGRLNKAFDKLKADVISGKVKGYYPALKF
jgi:hypothetical protein